MYECLRSRHKLPHATPKSEEVEKEITELVRRFPSQAEFQRRISQVGPTAEKLREIIEERVEIEKYLDFRFRSFIVITPREIGDYYREVYVPRMKQQMPGRIGATGSLTLKTGRGSATRFRL